MLNYVSRKSLTVHNLFVNHCANSAILLLLCLFGFRSSLFLFWFWRKVKISKLLVFMESCENYAYLFQYIDLDYARWDSESASIEWRKWWRSQKDEDIIRYITICTYVYDASRSIFTDTHTEISSLRDCNISFVLYCGWFVGVDSLENRNLEKRSLVR